MGHNILLLQAERFNARIGLGGCLININGVTEDCTVEVDQTNFNSPTYTVRRLHDNMELTTFRCYHMFDGPLMYTLSGVGQLGGNATLIVPTHGLLESDEPDNDDVDDSNSRNPSTPAMQT